MTQTTERYYEAHITVEPKTGMEFEEFRKLMSDSDWKASRFDADDVDGIEGKWFASARESSRYWIIYNRVAQLVAFLTVLGLEVTRFKIENTILDSKMGDTLILKAVNDG